MNSNIEKNGSLPIYISTSHQQMHEKCARSKSVVLKTDIGKKNHAVFLKSYQESCLCERNGSNL